jgi:hypothetical protein
MSHASDWHPGRNSNNYREGWERIFSKASDEKREAENVPRSTPSTGLDVREGSARV